MEKLINKVNNKKKNAEVPNECKDLIKIYIITATH